MGSIIGCVLACIAVCHAHAALADQPMRQCRDRIDASRDLRDPTQALSFGMEGWMVTVRTHSEFI